MADLSGKVSSITFHSEESGYTVMKLDTAKTNQRSMFSTVVTVVGTFSPAPQPDEELQLGGTWKKHPKYGDQFQVERITGRKIALTNDALEAYLASGLFPGIGPGKANSIVTKFGDKTGDVISKEPAKLAEVKGITSELATQIAEKWKEHEAARETMSWLCNLGLSVAIATRIYKTYGDGSIKTVKANPYTLARDVDGIGFQRADEIARLVLPDWSAGSVLRLQAGIIHTLKESRSEGHCYLPRPTLVTKASEILHITEESISTVLDGMKLLLVFEEDRVYLPWLHLTEREVADKLNTMLQKPESFLSDLKPKLESLRTEAEKKLGFALTDQQRQAVMMALSNKISIITGGPGVGKSTILKLITDILKVAEDDKTFALAAPTGRAAKRLAEATKQPASTIHRLLGYKYDPAGGYFEYDENHPLGVDMVVIDEASMLDLSLFRSLLVALKPGTHLLLVGDVDQLPSVGAGDVLRDMIRSQRFPVTTLKVIFRQGKDSRIVSNAHRINQGQMPDLTNTPDFIFAEADNPTAMQATIVDLVCNQLPKAGCSPVKDVQVLSPMYKGEAGVNVLNQVLRERLNPGKAERKFKAGDKVMQLVNNYELEVFNGDVGFVRDYDKEDKTTKIEMDDGRVVLYPSKYIEQLTLAYACTVHKSQGSEYPIVVLVVSNAHYIMLKRNLIYTGITRGKKLVVVVGEKRAIQMAVHRADDSKRFTSLVDRLTSAAKGQ